AVEGVSFEDALADVGEVVVRRGERRVLDVRCEVLVPAGAGEARAVLLDRRHEDVDVARTGRELDLESLAELILGEGFGLDRDSRQLLELGDERRDGGLPGLETGDEANRLAVVALPVERSCGLARVLRRGRGGGGASGQQGCGGDGG